MSELQDDLDVFHRKIRFQSPVANGAQHLAPHVMTGDERLAIERVVDAARRVANPDIEAAVSVLVGAYDVPPITAKIMARYAVLAALGITPEDE